IASFRALMGKNLGDIKGEFADFSHETFGDLTTLAGGFTALAATFAAAGVAMVSMVSEGTARYDEYADAISHSMRVTGQSAETMSMLHTAAAETHTSFESLTTGIVRFEGNVSNAAAGNTQLLASFAKLGVSQQDLKHGQQDLMPLLAKVMDGFAGTASAVDRAALAKQLFSRSGPELLT